MNAYLKLGLIIFSVGKSRDGVVVVQQGVEQAAPRSLLVSKPGAFKPSPPVRVITGAGMQNQMQAQLQMRSSTKQRYRDGDVWKVEKYAPQPEKQWSI